MAVEYFLLVFLIRMSNMTHITKRIQDCLWVNQSRYLSSFCNSKVAIPITQRAVMKDEISEERECRHEIFESTIPYKHTKQIDVTSKKEWEAFLTLEE